ncbi:unnamed protein product [Rotaria sp. Silwood2]|nr:unnamed protein product [Rotaria sp. Silwood2]
MSHRFLLYFIQRFSLFQQYLIILSVSLFLLVIFNHWWYILLLPLSTILANFAIKRLCRNNQSPLKFSGHIYNVLIRKRLYKQDDNTENTIHTCNSYETTIHKEYDTYIRTIIARYICVWYYPLISTDQEFPEDLMIIFHIILNRLNDQFKLLKSHDIIRLIINSKQKHMEEYLRAHDSYRKQRKPNRLSKSLVEEFSQINGFHRAIISNDIHAYIRALVELLLTNLIPESFQIYSGSRTGREFLTQIIVNCIFLPLFNQFSKPRMIYYLIILLWETEEEKKSFETNENSLIKQSKTNINENENGPVTLTEQLTDQQNHDDEPRSTRLERIIYSATIISCDTASDSMFGAAYTVYLIQCETKSPFTSDATHRYTIPRRFREFINLHKRLQQNHITSRHCYDIDEVFRTLPIPIDNMNPDVILLNLIHTCLHSRDAIISYQSIHQILRTFFGHFIEEFLKNQIDTLFSREKTLMYLIDLRTKVLWPDDNNTAVPMKNVKHRAYNACMKQIPNWLQRIVGRDNVRRIVMNVLDCLSYEQLNKHFICNLFDLFIEQLIPNIATEDFLTKYVQMHTGSRS